MIRFISVRLRTGRLIDSLAGTHLELVFLRTGWIEEVNKGVIMI